MTDQPTTPKPKRRWYQYRLRTLLIVTTIIAIALGWWSYRARQQREAVAILKGGDGVVRHDFHLPWTGKMNNPPQWPQWLENKVSCDYFESVILLFCSPEVTDASLEKIECLTALQELSLKGAKVTDAGLEHLNGLTSLRSLNLGRTQVTDAGLEHLNGITSLQLLYLNDTQVTDAGVARLHKALPNCSIVR
ncbi:MAG: hypothetical protein K8T25_16555 [Planctomycetia bacterium]|nr:hypothetical protein [Planctomycetia bacterium]